MKKGGPYLDKLPPQIKKTTQNNSSLLMALSGADGAGQIQKMIQRGAEKAKKGRRGDRQQDQEPHRGESYVYVKGFGDSV